MKKILILLLLIIPFIVKAETCDINKITIEEISIDNRNGNVIEKTEATIDNNIDLDLNMNNVGDNITYKITIKNNSYEDIEINEENIKNSEYIKYSIYNEEESLLIKARTSKTVFLKIKYEKEVPEELLVNDTYDDEMELSLALSSVGLINPKTGIVNYSVIIFAILLLGLSFYIVFRNKKYLYVLIIGFAFVIPIVLNASCKYNINIKANVKITSLAEFDIGMIVNEKMRLLAGDNQIKSFKRSNTISNEIKALADSQIDEMSRYVVSEEELNEMFELFKANADVIDKENGIKEKDGVINYCITQKYGEYCIKEYDMKYQLERSIAIIIRGDNFNDEYIIYNNDKCKLEIIDDEEIIKEKIKKYLINDKQIKTLKNVFSPMESNYVIYGWYDNNDKSINYYSEKEDVYLNKDSSKLFYRMQDIETLPGIINVNTSNVIDMSSMFLGLEKITSLDLSNFNTSKVIDMSYMFSGLYAITSLDLSNFDTSKVTNMSYMFSGLYAITSLDLSNFDTSKVTNMSHMFSRLDAITSLDLSDFDTSKVTNMSYMFSGLDAITSLDLSNFDTSKVTDMSYMFHFLGKITSLDLSNFDTSNVINMSSMFRYSEKITSLDLSNFNTSKVTDMSYMFEGCINLTSLDLSSFNTSNVTDMKFMFSSLEKITSLNLSNFDTSKVTNMGGMFMYLKSITSLDLSNFNTSNVTTISSMFDGCENLTSLDLSNFDTSKVTAMHATFAECSNLTHIDLSNWDTSNVTTMAYMFYHIFYIKTIDLSSFNTSKVTNTRQMFDRCNSLETLYASELWNVDNVTESEYMFISNVKLTGQNGTKLEGGNPKDATYARIDNPPDSPGYLTYKAHN